MNRFGTQRTSSTRWRSRHRPDRNSHRDREHVLRKGPIPPPTGVPEYIKHTSSYGRERKQPRHQHNGTRQHMLILTSPHAPLPRGARGAPPPVTHFGSPPIPAPVPHMPPHIRPPPSGPARGGGRGPRILVDQFKFEKSEKNPTFSALWGRLCRSLPSRVRLIGTPARAGGPRGS